MNNSVNIVMRADRLSSSDGLRNFATGTTANTITYNTPLMNQNPGGNIYFYKDGQVVAVSGGVSSPSYNQGFILSGNNEFVANAMNSFDCNGMVQFKCYQGNGLTFSVNPSCVNDDAVENGCYVFVREPMKGLFKPSNDNDITRWSEWALRFRFFYALCQGVLSNVFINN
jgi:hypothetical protein